MLFLNSQSKMGLRQVSSILFFILIYSFIPTIPAYAFNTAFMGKSEDFVYNKLGKPDRIIEFSSTETRFIYGETREGSSAESDYFITESYMLTFKKGKVVGVKASFAGDFTGGSPNGFPRLREYMTDVLIKTKPEVKKGRSGKWIGLSWKDKNYNYWARCYNQDLTFDRYTKKFLLKELNRYEDYRLVQYEILEKNYYKELYGKQSAHH